MLPAGSLDVVEPYLGAMELHPDYWPATSWVHYTTSCKHSLVLPRMGKTITQNMLSRLELLINRYCCI